MQRVHCIMSCLSHITSCIFAPCFSKEELQELLENEDKLIVFLSDLPQVQQISRDRAALSDFNEKAASKEYFQAVFLYLLLRLPKLPGQYE